MSTQSQPAVSGLFLLEAEKTAMTTQYERDAKAALQASVAKNKKQVEMAEETIRLLRDGDRLNKKFETADERPAMTRGEKWRFTKTISLEVVIAIVLQSAGAVWYVQGLAKNIEENRRRIELIESQRVAERLSALESQMLDSKGALLRIESKLDRIVEARR